MRWNLLIRKVHYWGSLVIAIPLLVIIATGLLLQIKKQSDWVQPAENRGSGSSPQIDLEGIFASVQESSEAELSWNDIDRIDVRPRKGLAKVLLQNNYEVQIDLGTGEVMQTAFRRSDVIESLHDGSWFGGNWTKLGVFLPTGVGLLLLWLTGLWLFWLPIATRRRRARLGNPTARRSTEPEE